MKNLIGLVLLLLVTGCASDKDMRDKFKGNLPIEFIEKSTGDIYLIEHNFGDNYNVRKWKDS